MIRSLDRGVGRVLQSLEDNGLTENTIVIFTSDNGGAGYIGISDVNKPFRGWKITNFEGGIHVPYFVKWPSKIKAGTTYKEPVHHFDIYSTIADAAGATVPTNVEVDGVSLLPYARGEQKGKPHETLFWRAGDYRTVRHNNWKMAVVPQLSKTWLFNLSEDPGETTNLADANPDVVDELMILLEEHNAQMVPPKWDSAGAMPINVDKHLRQVRDPATDTYIYWSN
jgi:arylsulfatase A-like enzyme